MNNCSYVHMVRIGSAKKVEINNLVRVSDVDFKYSNVLYNNLIDLIEQYYRLCMISYDACKYFNKRAWLLAGKNYMMK